MVAKAIVEQIRRGQFAIVDIAVTGREPVAAGVILTDEQVSDLRMRRDFHLLAEEEDLEVLIELERDLSAKLREMGAAEFFRWADETLSNGVRIRDREPVSIGRFDATLARLYSKHIPATVLRFETHVPVYSLEAAAGGFGKSMIAEAPESVEGWVEAPDSIRIDETMFAARVVGHSMEPLIPDGSLCLFRYGVTGSRQGRQVLIEDASAAGDRYTVKRYYSEKTVTEDGFAHTVVRFEPLNPDYQPIMHREGEDSIRVLAEFIAVLE